MLESVETDSVVDYFEPGDVPGLARVDGKGEPRGRGFRMFDDILQAFLRDSVQRELDVVGHAGLHQLDVDADLGMDRARLARPPASPRSSSTGGRSPLMAARASPSVRSTSSRAFSNCSEAASGSSDTARLAASSRYDKVISRCEMPS